MTNGNLKTELRWVQVQHDDAGNSFISPVGKYLVFGAINATGNVTLNAVNVVIDITNEKPLDMLASDSDLYTRLLYCSNSQIGTSNLRGGKTGVLPVFKQVQILEFFESQD